MNEFTCAEFRARRDYFQAKRREQVLPDLKAQETALWAEIRLLLDKRGAMKRKHDLQATDSEYKALWERWSYVWGQLAVIESEAA